MKYIKLYEELNLKRFLVVSTGDNKSGESIYLIRVVETYYNVMSQDMVEAVVLFNYSDGTIYAGKELTSRFPFKDVKVEYESDDADDAEEKFRLLIDTNKYNL